MRDDITVQADLIGRQWKTREEIAGHFQISPRTVGGWMRCKILSYNKIGTLVRFELLPCDRAFEKFKSHSALEARIPPAVLVGRQSLARTWKTKAQVAAHFRFSLRTITNLMARKTLPYVKLGNVVRFDLAECELIIECCRD
jgi:hypothetical protein